MEGLNQVSSDNARDLRTPLTRLRQRREQTVGSETSAESMLSALAAATRDVDSILETGLGHDIVSGLAQPGGDVGSGFRFVFLRSSMALRLSASRPNSSSVLRAAIGRRHRDQRNAHTCLRGSRQGLGHTVVKLPIPNVRPTEQ